MTKKEIIQLERTMKFDNHGLLLSYITRQILKNVNLTLMQDTTLHNIGLGGDYIPATIDILHKSVLEIMKLIVEEKIDSVITILKRLPTPNDGNTEVQFFVDGARVEKGIYFNGDGYKGKRTCKRVGRDNNKPFTDMTEEEYRKTKFSKTRMGELRGVQIFGEHYAYIRPLDNRVDEPIPEEPKPTVERKVYEDIGSDDVGLTEDEEFEFNEPAEKWRNR